MADTDHVDVLVIGTGAGGGVAARRLAEAGWRVLALERGDWTDPDQYPGARPEGELAANGSWSSQPAIRGGYGFDLSRSDVGLLGFDGVGGGTILYNAQWPRMLEDDFRVRSVDGVADDWPITYAELAPWYREADRQFGVSGLAGNPVYPADYEPPLPPLPIGRAGLAVARAHSSLGWHWWPATNAIASVGHDRQRPCVQRGTCGQGCNEGAKGSTDLTHWPHVIERGGRIVVGARVTRLIADVRGRAAGALWLDADGREHRSTADVVVLAANAVGTAALLLASADKHRPEGWANSSGLVGRRLMVHPLSTVTGRFDEPLDGGRGHNGGLIQCMEFARSDPSRGFVRGSTWGLGSAGGPLRAAFAPDGSGVWGDAHHRHVLTWLGQSAYWAVLVEDLPEDHNRVLASEGDPIIEYRTSENSRAAMAWHNERARESLEAAGAADIVVRAGVPNGHLMGTARMGDDPATSVVDRWSACHDIENLVIADGSVFVTAGSANPTSTIAALALRAADRLVESSGDGSRPALSRSFGPFDRAAVVRVAAPKTRWSWLDDGTRRRFAELADHLIPPAADRPAPSAVNVGGRLLDTALAAQPALAEPLSRALGFAGLPTAVVGDLATLDRAAWRALKTAVAGCYYMAPAVRALLGLDRPHAPVRTLDYPEYIEEGLLDHVLPRS